MTAPGATTNRDAIKARSPTWLQTGTGEKLLYSVGLMLDCYAEMARQGMIAHMPGQGTPDALPVIGQDRLIDQGFQESSAAYALRLQQSFDTWAGAGGAWRTLSNLLGFVSPAAPMVRVVTSGGIWDSINDPNAPNTGTPTWRYYSALGPGNDWNWDGTFPWWRAYTIIYSPPALNLWNPAPTIGSGPAIGQAPGSIGFSATPAQVQSMRKIAARWKGGNTWLQWMIVSFDTTYFPPINNAPKEPDGNWARWAKIVNKQYVSSRFLSAVYCDGAV